MKHCFASCTVVLLALVMCLTFQLKAQSGKTTVVQFSSDQLSAIFATAVDTGNRIISIGEFIDSAYIQNTKQGFSGKDSADAFIVCTDEHGNIIWKDIFGAPYATWANNVTTDNSGNYYVSGYFEKGFTIDGISFDSTAYYNAFLMKLDFNGKVEWGISYPYAYAIVENQNIAPYLTCDANGNLYYLLNMLGTVTINKHVFSNGTSGGGGDLMAKFDKNGNLVWGGTFINTGKMFEGYLTAAVADLFGSIYITGATVNGNITWQSNKIPGLADTITTGLFVAKLDAATGKMIWMKHGASSSPFSQLKYIAIGGDGSLYTAGCYADTLNIEEKKTPTVFGTADALVLNLDTSGKLIWLQHFGDPVEPDVPGGFCLDHSDNVYVGGLYDAPITLNGKNLFSTKARDVYVIRFDKAGNYINSASSKAVSAQSFTGMIGLMTDADNKLFVTGYLDNQTIFGNDTASCFGPSSSFIWEVTSSFTGIDPEIKQPQNAFRLYPNPLSGSLLNLEMNTNTKGSINVSCIDETGRQVFSQILQPVDGTDNNYSLSLPALKPGLYFIRLVSDDGITVGKFIKD